MAIGITLTGTTQAQNIQIGEAFDAQYPGRPDGVSRARWAELKVLQFIKSVVKQHARSAHDAAIDASVAQVDTDYQE
jgi:hypothetical protein